MFENVNTIPWLLRVVMSTCYFTDDGHSIYVRNLPFDTTPTQLEEVFKSFGAVKHEGIQVRSNKVFDINLQSSPRVNLNWFLSLHVCDV